MTYPSIVVHSITSQLSKLAIGPCPSLPTTYTAGLTKCLPFSKIKPTICWNHTVTRPYQWTRTIRIDLNSDQRCTLYPTSLDLDTYCHEAQNRSKPSPHKYSPNSYHERIKATTSPILDRRHVQSKQTLPLDSHCFAISLVGSD